VGYNLPKRVVGGLAFVSGGETAGVVSLTDLSLAIVPFVLQKR